MKGKIVEKIKGKIVEKDEERPHKNIEKKS